MRVAVLDDRRLVRETVEAGLRAAPDLAVVDADAPGAAHVMIVGVTKRRVDEGFAGVVIVRLDAVDDVDALPRHVVTAVRRTAPVPQQQAERRTRPTLTDREQQVLAAVGQGRSAEQIGLALGISRRTVERHKQAVMAKLGVPNQASAVARHQHRRLADGAV